MAPQTHTYPQWALKPTPTRNGPLMHDERLRYLGGGSRLHGKFFAGATENVLEAAVGEHGHIHQLHDARLPERFL